MSQQSTTTLKAPIQSCAQTSIPTLYQHIETTSKPLTNLLENYRTYPKIWYSQTMGKCLLNYVVGPLVRPVSSTIYAQLCRVIPLVPRVSPHTVTPSAVPKKHYSPHVMATATAATTATPTTATPLRCLCVPGVFVQVCACMLVRLYTCVFVYRDTCDDLTTKGTWSSMDT